MKKNGFTLVELLAVLVLISLVMAIAVPGIFKMRDRMNEKALNAKVESIENAAVIHVQNNSNKYKSIYGSCETDSEHCKCEGSKCKYVFTLKIKDLIASGDLKRENKDEAGSEGNSCGINNPLEKNKCMDCIEINITLDATYKTATASLDLSTATDPCL